MSWGFWVIVFFVCSTKFYPFIKLICLCTLSYISFYLGVWYFKLFPVPVKSSLSYRKIVYNESVDLYVYGFIFVYSFYLLVFWNCDIGSVIYKKFEFCQYLDFVFLLYPLLETFEHDPNLKNLYCGLRSRYLLDIY